MGTILLILLKSKAKRMSNIQSVEVFGSMEHVDAENDCKYIRKLSIIYKMAKSTKPNNCNGCLLEAFCHFCCIFKVVFC